MIRVDAYGKKVKMSKRKLIRQLKAKTKMYKSVANT